MSETIDVVFDPGGPIAPFWLRVSSEKETRIVELDAYSLPEAVGKADKMGLSPTGWFNQRGVHLGIPSGIVRHARLP